MLQKPPGKDALGEQEGRIGGYIDGAPSYSCMGE